MGILSEQLAAHVERLVARPRIYADANVPAGLVAHMRARLHWDVLFVLEQDDLRRASDMTHYHLALQLRRTLVTMDRDYLDDRRFPPAESGESQSLERRRANERPRLPHPGVRARGRREPPPLGREKKRSPVQRTPRRR